MDKFIKQRTLQIVKKEDKKMNEAPKGHFSESHLNEAKRQKEFKLRKLKKLKERHDK